jgi:hypothetical protein
LAVDGSRSGILRCVEIDEGFKSPILHLKPFATDREWLFSLKLWRQTDARRARAACPCLQANSQRIIRRRKSKYGLQ